jgi:hypothetical protein
MNILYYLLPSKSKYDEPRINVFKRIIEKIKRGVIFQYFSLAIKAKPPDPFDPEAFRRTFLIGSWE